MHFRRWAIVVTTCLVVTAVLAGYKIQQIRQAIAFAESFPEHSETVQALVAEEMQWTPMVTALGEVVASKSVALRNELGGRVVEVGFLPGSIIKKGQLLLRLDSNEESAQLKALEAEAELARLDLDRYQRLLKQNAASKDQLDRARAELAVALARAQAMQALIEKKTLWAPFDAYTGLHQLELGQYLGDNTLITELVGIDTVIWVDFSLPQQQAQLPIGTLISAHARGLLNTTLTGKVIARDSVVQTQSRNLRLRAAFTDQHQVLKPGAAVDLEIPLANTQTVTVLPVTAIRRDNFGSYVYVIVAAEETTPTAYTHFRAKKTTVTLGPQQQQRTIILSGLKAGERVAANGSYKLSDGMLVQVKSESLSSFDSNMPTDSGKHHE